MPALLRRVRPGVPILHFTHIPFAEPSDWYALPKSWPATILKGMLGADLAAYQTYRAAVLNAVDEINERFAEACGGPPIVVCLDTDRPLALAALERCDVLLANSLADGMNLVPKEWAVVTQRPGIAVISETAGVAADASDTALLVPPRDVERTALALGAALDMPRSERSRRLALFRDKVLAWTSRDWLSAQLADLEVPGTAEARVPDSPRARPLASPSETTRTSSSSFARLRSSEARTSGGNDVLLGPLRGERRRDVYPGRSVTSVP